MKNRAGTCKDCIAEGITTKRPAPHPGPRCATHHRKLRRYRNSAGHAKYVEATYGITGEQYQELYEAQGGKCFICRRATGAVKRLSVDHDHKTGIVRGLLCRSCNRDVLGHARDEVEFFQRAIEYLEDPPAVRLFGEIVAPIEEPSNG
jgi:hypothetical protein